MDTLRIYDHNVNPATGLKISADPSPYKLTKEWKFLGRINDLAINRGNICLLSMQKTTG